MATKRPAKKKKSLYDDMLALFGTRLDHRESDLFVPDTVEARAILKKHGVKYERFQNEAKGGHWLEVPFQYTPHFESPARGGAAPKAKKERVREPVDEAAATELELYIENDYDLVGAPNSMGKNIERMLLKKVHKGKFDLLASVRAWMYLMEAGAKKYAKEFGDGERAWATMFNKPTREKVATRFAREFATEHAGVTLS